MERQHAIIVNLKKQSLWRWMAAVILVGLAILLLETLEHRPVRISDISGDYLREVLLYGVAFPLLFLIILIQLNRTKLKQVRSERHISLERSLRRQLADARSPDEMEIILLQFPRAILPIIGAALMVCDETAARYEQVNHWSYGGGHLPQINPSQDVNFCSIALLSQWRSEGIFVPCCCLANGEKSEQTIVYCLPLEKGEKPLALLILYLPSTNNLTSEQTDLLLSVAPEMALAIERAQLERTVVRQVRETREERRRIARDLHDSLAQDLAYLRMKLDQLSTENDTEQGIAAVRQELGRMRQIADEAYNQVRQRLTSLDPVTVPCLATSLLSHARIVGGRAGFSVEMTTLGQAYPLSTESQRQILYIFHETLHNVERHANAKQVKIQLEWDKQGLSLMVWDDGKGFESSKLDTRKHFGLEIMRDRAQDIGGRIDTHSTKGTGTKVTLWLPCNIPSAPIGSPVREAWEGSRDEAKQYQPYQGITRR